MGMESTMSAAENTGDVKKAGGSIISCSAVISSSGGAVGSKPGVVLLKYEGADMTSTLTDLFGESEDVSEELFDIFNPAL